MPLAEHDTLSRASGSGAYPFQFTGPSRSTADLRRDQAETTEVSMHVPLAEHDEKRAAHVNASHSVSIHVPLAEHDASFRFIS